MVSLMGQPADQLEPGDAAGTLEITYSLREVLQSLRG